MPRVNGNTLVRLRLLQPQKPRFTFPPSIICNLLLKRLNDKTFAFYTNIQITAIYVQAKHFRGGWEKVSEGAKCCQGNVPSDCQNSHKSDKWHNETSIVPIKGLILKEYLSIFKFFFKVGSPFQFYMMNFNVIPYRA